MPAPKDAARRDGWLRETTMEHLSRRSFVKGGFAVSALGLLGSTTALAAQPVAGHWVKLGSRTVDLGGDHSTFPVTFLSGAFTHLQLRVQGNPVYVNELKVRFSNAEWVTLPVRARFRDGGQSRAIALPGAPRYVSLVRLENRPARNGHGHQATVEVWGQR
jgi:hypothetical protein